MARKKGEEESCGNWMDTYGDMVTLLLTFFIMLYSMSSINQEKWEKVVRAFANSGIDTQQVVIAPEGTGSELATNKGENTPAGEESIPSMDTPPENFNDLYEYLQAYVTENKMEGSVEVSQGDGNVYVRFQDNVLYDPDSSTLKPTGIKVLDFLGTGLIGVQDQILTINIAGHTAAVQNGDSYRVSDWDLSAGRAASVAIYLEEEKEIEPKKLMPIGYGKNSPIADNETMEGRQKNRRVDMTIISKDSEFSNEEAIQQFLAGTFDASKYPSSGGAMEILMPDLEGSSSSTSSSAASTSSESTSTQAESNSISSEDSASSGSSVATSSAPASGGSSVATSSAPASSGSSVAASSAPASSGSSVATSPTSSSAPASSSSVVAAVPMANEASGSSGNVQSGVSPYDDK